MFIWNVRGINEKQMKLCQALEDTKLEVDSM